jgi:hypothetical protein
VIAAQHNGRITVLTIEVYVAIDGAVVDCSDRKRPSEHVIRNFCLILLPGIEGMPKLICSWLLENNPFQADSLRTVSCPSSDAERPKKDYVEDCHIYLDARPYVLHPSLEAS